MDANWRGSRRCHQLQRHDGPTPDAILVSRARQQFGWILRVHECRHDHDAGAQSIGTGDGLLGQYYPGININFATATPTLTRVDPTINFNWSTTGPVAALGNTNYSVRWTGEIQAQFSQAYTFYTTSDDGIRVIIGGQTVINDYADHAATVDASAPIQFTAGQSATIEIDYFQDTGPAQAVLEWSSLSTPEEVIPQTQLFSGSAPAAPVLAVPVAASGTQLNLSWTESSNFENGFEIDRKVGAGALTARSPS